MSTQRERLMWSKDTKLVLAPPGSKPPPTPPTKR